MMNSIIFGLIALQALLVVGTFSSVATPALAVEKSADDKINKMYEICNKIIGYYDDYNFGNEKTYKVYKLCDILLSKSK
jgi:chitinase